MFPLNVVPRCRAGIAKTFCTQPAKSKLRGACESGQGKPLGQPAHHTHPHLLGDGEVTPLIKKGEYQCRRQNLVESVVSNATKSDPHAKRHMIVIPAATKQYMSDKIPYVFRQNSEFLYLTGCQEPDTCCVIMTGESPGDHRTTLFTRDKDEHAELWDGPRTHPEDAPAFFGVDQSLPVSELSNFLLSCRKEAPDLRLWYDVANPVHRDVHQIVCDYLKEVSAKTCESPRSFIHKLRLYKSTAEMALMQKSGDIASKAIAETMAFSRPGIGEDQLFAKVDFECRMRGAEFLAYPPVVAGGSRATTIHYIDNNQVLSDDELVLMDAGCEYHGYASDVTRTWPVNGKFTAPQREIYEIVLDVQEQLIQLCGQYPTLDSLFESMCYLLGKKLQDAGLVGPQPSNNYLMKAAYQLCPHHVSHYLGMDVHDTPSLPRNIKIEPGMVITVEPGIYVSDRNSTLPKEYHNIGVRIEDDVLITVNGPVVLSRKCPKTVSDIEAVVREGTCVL
ncbi:xaa-Pro aminopeptidase 3 [Cylas formicarius]|uniref:xaa-Pro aminopeptidase 3 n=1 Tax=Cylas formicarius TaxID=197179 RepID=UPI002958464A|nr:xaa-Pro aminopeptidase 3 [Cylas formicarius]